MKKATRLHIRNAQDNEREAIRNVILAAYAEYAKAMPGALFEAYRRQMLATLDEEGSVERLVAESDGLIVGCVLLYPPQASVYSGLPMTTSWPEVRLLAVVPEARGQGVGSALMDECERRARRAGAAVLGLHTMDIMQEAMRLYEHRGFTRAPELDFQPAKGVVVKGYRLNLL